MNNFTGIGRIVNNLELRSTNNGNSVCQFTIAINEVYGDKERTDFIDCVAWNKRAESICKYCDKGVKVAIEGKLQTDTYEKEGKKIKITKVLVNEIQFIEKIKDKKEMCHKCHKYPAEYNQTYCEFCLGISNKNKEEVKEESDPFKEFGDEIADEDLPF